MIDTSTEIGEEYVERVKICPSVDGHDTVVLDADLHAVRGQFLKDTLYRRLRCRPNTACGDSDRTVDKVSG